MDRHAAYQLLAETVEHYRGLGCERLTALVGQRRSERVTSASGDELLVDVVVEQCVATEARFRVSVTVDSPSTFRLERVEETFVISGEM